VKISRKPNPPAKRNLLGGRKEVRGDFGRPCDLNPRPGEKKGIVQQGPFMTTGFKLGNRGERRPCCGAPKRDSARL